MDEVTVSADECIARVLDDLNAVAMQIGTVQLAIEQFPEHIKRDLEVLECVLEIAYRDVGNALRALKKEKEKANG